MVLPVRWLRACRLEVFEDGTEAVLAEESDADDANSEHRGSEARRPGRGWIVAGRHGR